MQPLRPLLLLAGLAGARANCVDPGSVSPDDVGTKYCCPGIASELKTGQGCCSNRISVDCDAGTAATTKMLLPTAVAVTELAPAALPVFKGDETFFEKEMCVRAAAPNCAKDDFRTAGKLAALGILEGSEILDGHAGEEKRARSAGGASCWLIDLHLRGRERRGGCG